MIHARGGVVAVAAFRRHGYLLEETTQECILHSRELKVPDFEETFLLMFNARLTLNRSEQTISLSPGVLREAMKFR